MQGSKVAGGRCAWLGADWQLAMCSVGRSVGDHYKKELAIIIEGAFIKTPDLG